MRVPELEILRRFVHAVVEVEDLATAATYVPECDVALIRADLTPAGRRLAADWLLAAAVQRAADAEQPQMS